MKKQELNSNITETSVLFRDQNNNFIILMQEERGSYMEFHLKLYGHNNCHKGNGSNKLTKVFSFYGVYTFSVSLVPGVDKQL